MPRGKRFFGSDDELKLTLEGTCSGKIARFIGTAEQFPGVALKEHSSSQRATAACATAERVAAKVRSEQTAEVAEALPLITQHLVPHVQKPLRTLATA